MVPLHLAGASLHLCQCQRVGFAVLATNGVWHIGLGTLQRLTSVAGKSGISKTEMVSESGPPDTVTTDSPQ